MNYTDVLLGPSATAVPDDSLHKRMQSADSALNAKQKKKIGRTEGTRWFSVSVFSTSTWHIVIEGKRLSKVIKRESKVEKQSLEVSIKELGELQQIQQAAIKVIILLRYRCSPLTHLILPQQPL